MNDSTYYTAIQTGALLQISFLIWMLSLAISVFAIVCVWKIFKKAGREGWEAIIPIYNIIVYFKICGINPWVLLWILLPFVGSIIVFVFTIKACVNLAKAFGKTSGFAVGLIFLGYIFQAILAFDSSVYNAQAIQAK